VKTRFQRFVLIVSHVYHYRVQATSDAIFNFKMFICIHRLTV